MHSRVVVEAAHLAEVEEHRIGEPVGAEQPVDLRQVPERRLRPRILHEPLRPVQHVPAPVEGRQRQQQLRHRRRRVELPDQALERRLVLVAERRPELARDRLVGSQVFQDTAEERRLAHVDLEPLEAESLQALDGHRDHLGVALGVGQADQLHAGLVELPVAAHVGLVVAEDIAHIGESERLGLVPHPRRHDARDLGRDVRAEREEAAALAVHHLEHPLPELVVRALGDDVEVLVGGRHDLAVAPAPKHPEQALLDDALLRRLLGEVELDPLGELGLPSAPVHGQVHRYPGDPAIWPPGAARGGRGCSCGEPPPSHRGTPAPRSR